MRGEGAVGSSVLVPLMGPVGDPGDTPPPLPSGGLTIQRSHRLVSLAVRRVTLAGAMSGGAWRVWIFLEGWLAGLVPTIFTWRMRKLVGGGVCRAVRAQPQG